MLAPPRITTPVTPARSSAPLPGEPDPLSEPIFQNAVVIGVGLIGGSIAKALRERGVARSVTGLVRSERAASRAVASGAVEKAVTEQVEGADLVIACTPVETIPGLLAEAAKHAAPDCLLTDAGSTKGRLVEQAESQLPEGSRFVGSHPLAGDHQTGPEHSRGDLFQGATTVVTPTPSTMPEAVEAARALWESLGSTVVSMAPERHDEVVAMTSHVPHVAAAAVAATTPADALPLAATGWADTTRVAAGSESLWREILLANRTAVREGISGLIEELTSYRDALEAADSDRLEKLLQTGRERREQHGRQDALGS